MPVIHNMPVISRTGEVVTEGTLASESTQISILQTEWEALFQKLKQLN